MIYRVHISIYYIIYHSTYYQYIFRLTQIYSFHFIPCNRFAFLKIFSILEILGAHLRFFLKKEKDVFDCQPNNLEQKEKVLGFANQRKSMLVLNHLEILMSLQQN